MDVVQHSHDQIKIEGALVALVNGDRRIEIPATQKRVRQTLAALIDAGPNGVTSLEISSWALRLSEYIRRLRHDYHLSITTQDEPHDIGGIKATHGRYRLVDRVEVLEPSRAAA